jgi:hypothetical protein
LVSVEVNKAVPLILEMPVAGSMSYGKPLSASVLSGGSGSVQGSFEWLSPAVTPTAGLNEFTFRFVPADSENYATATGVLSVLVNKTVPVVFAAPSASALRYGQTLGQAMLSGGSASTAGSFSFALTGLTPAVGEGMFGFVFTPADFANYLVATGSMNVTVNKAVPVVNPPVASPIFLGLCVDRWFGIC